MLQGLHCVRSQAAIQQVSCQGIEETLNEVSLQMYMKNLRYHFPTCYAYSVKEPIGELHLKRALDGDTGVFLPSFPDLVVLVLLFGKQY